MQKKLIALTILLTLASMPISSSFSNEDDSSEMGQEYAQYDESAEEVMPPTEEEEVIVDEEEEGAESEAQAPLEEY